MKWVYILFFCFGVEAGAAVLSFLQGAWGSVAMHGSLTVLCGYLAVDAWLTLRRAAS